jgi:hypothetical protein
LTLFYLGENISFFYEKKSAYRFFDKPKITRDGYKISFLHQNKLLNYKNSTCENRLKKVGRLKQTFFSSSHSGHL